MRTVLIDAGLRKELVESVTGLNASPATMMRPHSVAVLVRPNADGLPEVLSAVAYQWHSPTGMAQVRAGADTRAAGGEGAARQGPSCAAARRLR